MNRRTLQILFTRIQAPDPVSNPWQLRWLPLGLLAAYGFVFLAALLFLVTLAEADVTAPEAGLLAWVYALASILTLGITLQYTDVGISKAKETGQLSDEITLPQALGLIPSENTPLWGVMLMAFGLAVVLDTFGLIIGVPPQSLPLPLDNLPTSDTTTFVIGVLALVLLRPLGQGLIFQGVLYPALLKLTDPLRAIFITSLVLAILSFAMDPQYLWWGMVYPFLMGLIATIARAATKSTLTAIGVQMMFGVFIFLRAILY